MQIALLFWASGAGCVCVGQKKLLQQCYCTRVSVNGVCSLSLSPKYSLHIFFMVLPATFFLVDLPVLPVHTLHSAACHPVEQTSSIAANVTAGQSIGAATAQSNSLHCVLPMPTVTTSASASPVVAQLPFQAGLSLGESQTKNN